MCPLWHRRDRSPAAFFEQLRIRVCCVSVDVVATLLPFEIHLGVAPLWWRMVVVLAFDTLVRGTGLNQEALHAAMFVTGELGPVSGVFDTLEEQAGEAFVEQPFVVDAEAGKVPDPVFEVQANDPAVQPVVVDGRYRQPLAAHGEQDLQQQGIEQHCGWNRKMVVARVHRIELCRHG